MGLLSRLSFVVQSKINALLNRAEDPNESLDYAEEQMRDQINDLETALSDLATEKQQLVNQRDSLEEEVEEENANAREAVEQDNEDLARKFLTRKKEKMAKVEDLNETIQNLDSKQESIEETLDELRKRREQFSSEKDMLKARNTAAETEVKVNEIMSGVGDNSIQDRIADMEDSIDEKEARSEALDELSDEGVLGDNDSIDEELADARIDSEVETELETLKAEMETN